MDFAGKTLVILLTAACVMFMAWTVGIYATHQPWNKMVTENTPGKPLGLAAQLDKERAENQVKKDRLLGLQGAITAETQARRIRVTQLEQERVALDKKLQDLLRKRKELNEASQMAADMLKQTEVAVLEKRATLKGLQEERDNELEARKQNLDKAVRVTADITELNIELSRVETRFLQLSEQLKKLQEVVGQN